MNINLDFNKTWAYFCKTPYKIRLRCPKCVQDKKWIQHCKIHDSLAETWYHFVREHGEISDSQLRTEDVFQTLNNIAWAMEKRMFPYPNDITMIYTHTTTTSSLSFNNKPIRRPDVLHRLERISHLLRTQSKFFPEFKIKQIDGLIKVVLDNPDDRTIKKYRESIIDSSKKNIEFGLIDVTDFCNKFN